jgi:hypothetical protein
MFIPIGRLSTQVDATLSLPIDLHLEDAESFSHPTSMVPEADAAVCDNEYQKWAVTVVAPAERSELHCVPRTLTVMICPESNCVSIKGDFLGDYTKIRTFGFCLVQFLFCFNYFWPLKLSSIQTMQIYNMLRNRKIATTLNSVRFGSRLSRLSN